MAEKATVHRDLHRVSPSVKGADVKALQKAIKAQLNHYKIDWLTITVDGELGPETIDRARYIAWVLGLGYRVRLAIKKGRISQRTQLLIRHPERRNRAMVVRSKAHQGRLAAIRKAQGEGAAAAVKWGLLQEKLGVEENPAGSNSNPNNISIWERYFGLGACFWCGVMAGYAVKAIGKAQVTGSLVYGPSIINDARAHQNGMTAVPVSQAQPGDIFVYWGGEHIGLCRAKTSGDTVFAVEGNTSKSDGSQSNGGCVALKERSAASDVTVCARPLYKRHP